MDLVGHLTELRNRLMITLAIFCLFFITGIVFVKDIYAFFINDITNDLTVLSAAEIVWIYFRMAGIVALTGTIPVLAFQIWAFVSPGLTPYERRVSMLYIPFVFLLFVGGLAFGYVVFVQLIFPFILSLSDGMFNVMITVEGYFKFLFRITVPFALLFELPVGAMFLTTLGVLTPDHMKNIRKYAYFAIMVVSTLLTPPDFLLPLLVSVPFILLYEVSIHLSKVVYRKKQEQLKTFMQQESI